MKILHESQRPVLTIVSPELEALHSKLGPHSGILADIHAELLDDLQDAGYGDWLVHDWNNGSFSVAVISNTSNEVIVDEFNKAIANYDIEDYL